MAGSVDGLFDLPIAEQLDSMLRDGVSPRDVARYVQEDMGVFTDVSLASLVAVIRGRKDSLSLVRSDDDVHTFAPDTVVRSPRQVYATAQAFGLRAARGDGEAMLLHAALVSMQDNLQLGIDGVNRSKRFSKELQDALRDYTMTVARVYEVQRKFHADEKKADADAALARANEQIAQATASLPSSLSKVMSNPESRQKLLAFAARMRSVHRVIDVVEPEDEPQAVAETEADADAGP
jgi:hypothetical protein